MNPTVTYYPSIFQISIGDVFRANMRGLQDPDPQGYTKHYYAESERIASKLGNGGLQELGHPLADDIQVHDKLFANKNHAQNVIYECLNAEEVRAYPPLSYLYELTNASQSLENERYFYHPDHLGSSSWITFTNGEAVQHLHYLPYGEDLVNQQHTAVGAMYTFSAKEKDAETGYSYFGSRYYNSDLSIWLSVDPMSDKYPHLSNYVYCSNNPIRVVDPNGEDEYEFDECGNLINTICNDKIDKFHILDGEGNRKCSSRDFKANTFSITKDDLFGTLMEVTNGENHEELALDAFEFFADNTEVEWECITTDRTSYVGTSKMNHSTNINSEVLGNGESLKIHRHNHPSGSPYPSGEIKVVDGVVQRTKDRKAAENFERIFPRAIFEIYTKGGNYQQYDKNGIVIESSIIIKP